MLYILLAACVAMGDPSPSLLWYRQKSQTVTISVAMATDGQFNSVERLYMTEVVSHNEVSQKHFYIPDISLFKTCNIYHTIMLKAELTPQKY